MAKLSAHGRELTRYLRRNGVLCAVMEDGVTLGRTIGSGWKVYRRKRPEIAIEEWRRVKLEKISALPAWQRECKSLPSMNTIQEWISDSVCESVTGDTVEPDGHGPDGAPSWLLVCGMI